MLLIVTVVLFEPVDSATYPEPMSLVMSYEVAPFDRLQSNITLSGEFGSMRAPTVTGGEGTVVAASVVAVATFVLILVDRIDSDLLTGLPAAVLFIFKDITAVFIFLSESFRTGANKLVFVDVVSAICEEEDG